MAGPTARGELPVSVAATGGASAAGHAVDLASTCGAELHDVYVVDIGTYADEDVPRSVVGLSKEGDRGDGGGGRRRQGCRRPDRDGCGAGVPYEEVLDYARNEVVDLIAMGTRGETSEVHLGGTTAKVVSTSGLPVLTVP